MPALTENQVLAMTQGAWIVSRLTELRATAGMPPLDPTRPYLVAMPQGLDGCIVHINEVRATLANRHAGPVFDLPIDDGGELDDIRVGSDQEPSTRRRIVGVDGCHDATRELLIASATCVSKGLISDDTHQYNREAAYRIERPFDPETATASSGEDQ